MKSIYLISTKARSKRGKYKLGKHTGSENKLVSRYTTSLINPIVFFFCPVNNADKIENMLKKRLLKYRIVSNRGTVLEWIRWELKNIIAVVDRIVDKYDEPDYDEINKIRLYGLGKSLRPVANHCTLHSKTDLICVNDSYCGVVQSKYVCGACQSLELGNI